MATAQQVYDLALTLIDEVTESGALSPDNPQYYQKRALAFLTILQAELLPISEVPAPVTSLGQSLQFPDRIALSVFPYGLAAHLLMNEDINLASFLNARYDELKRKIPTRIKPIKDVYGVNAHGKV